MIKDKFYEKVGSYTKYKVIEMLIHEPISFAFYKNISYVLNLYNSTL